MSEQERETNDAVFDSDVTLQRARAILRLVINEYFDGEVQNSIMFIERDFDDIAACLSTVQCLLHEAVETLDSIV